MRTSRAGDKRREGARQTRAVVVLAALAGVSAANAVAAEQGRWPRATFYTVVARAGDTASGIAQRYRVAPSLVARLNSLKMARQVTAGRILLIPAMTRTTREAVLAEATDYSAPNYATQPGSSILPHAAPSPRRIVEPGVEVPLRDGSSIPARDPSPQEPPRFAWPIIGPVISSFGPGDHGTRNEGINIAAERGAPFRAAADGTVIYTGPLRGYGNLILIAHKQSYVTAYAHAANIAVTRGEFVGKGQVIGTAGSSGGVDRPQLHFEIRRGQTAVDPDLLLAVNS